MCLHPTGTCFIIFRAPRGLQPDSNQLTDLVCVEAQKIKFNKRRHFCCQHSKNSHPHAQDTPRTAFWTLQQEMQAEVTVATVYCKQLLSKRSASENL